MYLLLKYVLKLMKYYALEVKNKDLNKWHILKWKSIIMDFHFKMCLLFKSLFFTSSGVCCMSSYIPIQVIFRLYASSESSDNLFIFTKDLNFNFFSICHCFVFMGKILCSQKQHVCTVNKTDVSICFHYTSVICHNIVYINAWFNIFP